MSTLTVTSAADSGVGTLRDAIDRANLTLEADTINFAIGSGPATISIGSSLTITQPITIDATSQPGYAGSPIVRLTDAGTTNTGIVIDAANTVVRGLSITNMGAAANPTDGNAINVLKNNVTIEKCFIGLAPSGVAASNENDGIYVGGNAFRVNVRDNVIGANFGDGIETHGNVGTFQSNKIGTDPTGLSARGNAGHGIHNLMAFNILVGGDLPSQGNIICANGLDGIYFSGVYSSGSVLNNLIGVDATGNAKLANGDYGVELSGTDGAIVGAFGKGNRIGGDGILLSGNGTLNEVRNNEIGIGANTAIDVGDTYGIDINAAYDSKIEFYTIGRCATGIRIIGGDNRIFANNIGITASKQGIPNTIGVDINGNWNRLLSNSIAFNSTYGARVASGQNNSVDQNSIWANGQSVKLNAGANTDAVTAEITGVTQSTTTGLWEIDTFMNIPLGTRYRISYYQNDFAGNTLSGHTQTLIDSQTVEGTDAFEPNTVTLPASALQDGRYLTVMVTKLHLVSGGSVPGASSQPTSAVKLVGLPAVHSNSFDYETGHAWIYTFSSDVSASLSASDIEIKREDGLTFVPNAMTWNAATRTARFTRSTPLPDGRYTARLKVKSVTNGLGGNLDTFALPFHVLSGDATRDGTVNFDDLLRVAQNYGQTGKTFSQGDFNYDSKVDFLDLLTLAQRFGTSLFSSEPIGASSSGRSRNADLLN